MKQETVVLGLLGTQLDQAPRRDRWHRWRPTVAICQQDDLVVDRLVLLYEQRSHQLLREVSQDIEAVSPETSVQPYRIAWDDPWDFQEVYAELHDFSRNFHFDSQQNEYLTHITTGTHVAQICLFLLTESRHLPGKLLQTSPVPKQQRRPAGEYRIIDLDLSKYDRLASRFQEEHREATSFLKSGIETKDEQFNALIDRIEQVSLATKAPILLTGPTGAGKSQLAKRIFELRRRRELLHGSFVAVNCATLRGDQAMSTLFGHTKGAFTGAGSSRSGLLQAADGGLLFLDEVGELGLDEQAMLLHALEEKIYLPVGSDVGVRSDFQLIAGTNRDLLKDVGQGRFREDLLARINLWTFPLPGLKDRRQDIEPNMDYELQAFAREHGRQVTFNREARDNYLEFAHRPSAVWQANFRDLNASITRMATLAPAARIDLETVRDEIQRLQASWHPSHAPDSTESDGDLVATLLDSQQAAQLDRFDRVQLNEVLRVCRQAPSLAAAGRVLFQASRQTKKSFNDSDRLRKYLAKYGLSWQGVHHHGRKS